ncbi:MAG: SPOR domain-containing protein [Rickettsiales bacterium]|jgi:predicted outer membrane repeat protein|nr:SPOR domain-containing protein [Rickettsiales bacterium]
MKRIYTFLITLAFGLNFRAGFSVSYPLEIPDDDYTYENSTITDNPVHFHNSHSRDKGGILHIGLRAKVGSIESIGWLNFVNNSTSEAGGAIYTSGLSLIREIKSNFTSNCVGDCSWSNPTPAGSHPASTSAVFGGAIYNSGTINVIDGSFTDNYAKNTSSASGGAYGGAIYNDGRIATINGSFTGNYAQSNGTAYGGAIYTRGNITFVAKNNIPITFTGNYVKDNLGKIYNAIYVGAKADLTFNAESGSSITVNDRIESYEVDELGKPIYNIKIIGDGETVFNNYVVNAKKVSIESSALRLGFIGRSGDQYIDNGDSTYVYGLFIPEFNTDIKVNYYDSPMLPLTAVALDNGKLFLAYATVLELHVEELTMKNGSTIYLDPSSSNVMSGIYARTAYNFYGKDNKITGAVDAQGIDTATGDINFSNKDLNFWLLDTNANGDTVLTVNGIADITNSKVSVGLSGAGQPLSIGDTITLIDAVTLNGDIQNVSGSGNNFQVVKGVSLVYDLEVSKQGNQLIATVSSGIGLNPQTKSFSEGNLAGVAFVNVGADVASTLGIASAAKAADEARGSVNMFAASAVGKSRYKTGSYIDSGGISLMLGLSAAAADSLVVGGFAEYGQGVYDSFNDFATVDSIAAGGNITYIGGGLLGRYSFWDGVYIDTTLRAGFINTTFESSEFTDFTQLQPAVKADFDSKTLYYGGHFGAGYNVKLTDSLELDASAKYLLTIQAAHDVEVSTGETVKFDNLISHRIRAGGKLTTGNGAMRPYAGLYVDYEFDGESKASIFDLDVSVPNLSGTTGVGQLGLAIESGRLSAGFGIEGYLGMRNGFGALLTFRYRLGSDVKSVSLNQTRKQAEETAQAKVAAANGNEAVASQKMLMRSYSIENPAQPAAAAVAVPLAAGATGAVEVGAGPYTIQVGAYYTEERARSIAAKVAYIGNVTIVQESEMYKVQFRNLSESEAKRIIEELPKEKHMRPGLLKNGRWTRMGSL